MRRFDAAFVSTGFFTTLGVTLQAGRDFAEVDDQRGRSPVVILSDGFWRRSLGADPAVLGREVVVSGLQVSVIGIAPAHFRGLRLGRPVDLFFPLESARELVEGVENLFAAPNTGYSPVNWLILTGRLDGVTPGAAVSRLDGILEEVRGDNGRWLLTDVQTAAIPRAVRLGVSRFMSLLGWTVALLLLTGSLGVGTLLRIRTESRRREFGIRLALGAPRLRLVGDVAAEAFILAAAGSVLALPLAVWEFSLIRVFELPGRIAIQSLSLPEAGGLLASVGALGAVATVVITVAGAAFGLAAQPSVMRRLQGARDMPGSRARTALVATQVAITLVLLTGTGLFLRSVTAALALNPGYDAANLASGAVSLPEGYSEAGADALFRTIRDRMEASPAMTSASVTSRRGAMSSGGELIVNGIGRRFPTAVWFTAVDEFLLSDDRSRSDLRTKLHGKRRWWSVCRHRQRVARAGTGAGQSPGKPYCRLLYDGRGRSARVRGRRGRAGLDHRRCGAGAVDAVPALKPASRRRESRTGLPFGRRFRDCGRRSHRDRPQ